MGSDSISFTPLTSSTRRRSGYTEIVGGDGGGSKYTDESIIQYMMPFFFFDQYMYSSRNGSVTMYPCTPIYASSLDPRAKQCICPSMDRPIDSSIHPHIHRSIYRLFKPGGGPPMRPARWAGGARGGPSGRGARGRKMVIRAIAVLKDQFCHGLHCDP